jgi:hypothetical protein
MTFTRVRALIIVAVLFMTAGVAVVMAVGRDSQTASTETDLCADGLVPARIKMPERDQVTLNVFNGTSRSGLAEQIGAEFKSRGFKVNPKPTAPVETKPYDQIAQITYGPDAVGAAWLTSAYFLVNDAEMQFDINRKGAEVDVVLGEKFQQLATSTEVNQSIAAIGNPSLPDGTCEAV